MSTQTCSKTLSFGDGTVSVYAADNGTVTNWYNVKPEDRVIWLREAARFIELAGQLRDLEAEFEDLDERQAEALKKAELLWISEQAEMEAERSARSA